MQTEDTARSPKLQGHFGTKIPLSRQAFAESQRYEILQLLREAGPVGVGRDFLIFTRHYTQCASRVNELKRQGYQIESELRSGDRYVTSVPRGEPEEPKPLRNIRQKKLFGDHQMNPRAGSVPNPAAYQLRQHARGLTGCVPSPLHTENEVFAPAQGFLNGDSAKCGMEDLSVYGEVRP